MSWQTILAIGSGGFIGALLRAYLHGFISHKLPHTLPFATLGINLLGSFFMGVLIAFFLYTSFFSPSAKSFLTTGVLGALTTYSTFAIETLFLLQGGHLLLACTNLVLNALGTVIASAGGFYAVKYFFAKGV
ncbi:MAG: fluoride efflux transporter CrcB [Sulfurimonadaceae bacterium]|jgi:CrcB protein